MPRLPPSLLRHAHQTSPYLRRLLPICRDLASAKNELRWIREHVNAADPRSPRSRGDGTAVTEQHIARLCARRGRGEPLQYVLGSQPFGTLDIKCRPGVLIPRPETEAYVFHLAELVRRAVIDARGGEKDLTILDFCTGTGCIALLLYSLLHSRFSGAVVRGFDISDVAISLARENLQENVRRALLPTSALEPGVKFDKADIFSNRWERLLELKGRVDLLISNPPYISAKGFDHDTGRSVRNFEPKLALVPDAAVTCGMAGKAECEPEDVFYARLFEISETLRPKIMLFEVGDLAQAVRVAQMASRLEARGHVDIEIWRDWPDMTPEDDELTETEVDGRTILIKGSGNGRSVMIRCGS